MIHALENIPKVMACILAISLAGCDQQWSESERNNIQHFVESTRLINEAHDIANSATGGDSMSMTDFRQIVALYEQALAEAKLVTDPVLAKANPALPKAYRQYFQRGIELCLSSWTKQQPSEDLHGDALLDKWGDWLEENRENIDLPR